MIEHHIQKTIVYTLAHSDGLRFSELQPEGIENKLFSYHLNKVVFQGLVKKDSDIYKLTEEGRSLWQQAVKDQKWFAELPHSAALLIIRRIDDGAWLLARRVRQPLKGQIGLPYAQPMPNETLAESATKTMQMYAGLDLDFEYRGSGYMRMFDGQELDSFLHFTLHVCEAAEGDLDQNNDLTEFFWEAEPDFNSDEMIKSIPAIIEAYESGEQFFIEETIRY